MDVQAVYSVGVPEGQDVLQVRFFGTLELWRSSAALPLPRFAVSQSLLAYLLLYNDRPHARVKLAGTFWPELPEARARAALRRHLWDIRRAMGDWLILSDREKVWLAEDIPLWRDVTAFEDALSEGTLHSLSSALSLYRGRFLEGFYDDWALLESERLHEAYLQALHQLIALTKNRGDYEAALTYARSLVSADPLLESAHREIMHLCYLLGRPEAALRQFERCCELLKRELGVEPQAETLALAREISARGGVDIHLDLTGASATEIPYALEPNIPMPLIGRDEERQRLVELMQAAFQGQGGLVLLGGEAGVGKSRLLRALAGDAEWYGATVLWGRTPEPGLGTTYHALREAVTSLFDLYGVEPLMQHTNIIWLQAAAPLIPMLAEMLSDYPPLPPLGEEHARTRLFEAFAHIILAASRIRPVLILLEDLHWSDPALQAVLRFLAPRLSEGRVLVAGSYRLGEAETGGDFDAWLEEMIALPQVAHLILDRLSETETLWFIQRGLGLKSPAPLFANRLYQESGGNPLFLLETLRTLHEQGVLVRDEQGEWSTPWDESTEDYSELPLSPAVEQMILQRLEKLSPAARQVIQIAAVLGEIFRFAVLRRVSPLDQSTTLRALADLTRHRLLERAEADYRFSHAVVRTVAYSSMDAESRRILHRKVVEALESMPACPAEVLAHHCDQGGLSEKAASYFAQAGREAMALYALPQALEYFSRAVELDDGFSPEERFALYVDYESALDMVGAQKQHAEILERMNRLAKASANANWRLKVYLCKARYYTEVGDLDKAEAQAQQALAAARAAADPGSEARALMLYGRIANLRARAADGLEPLGKAVALFRESGDRAGEAEAINELANAQLAIKAYAEARENCEAALALCEALDDRPGQANALGLLGIIVMEQGDIEAAEAYYRRELEIARSIGYRYSEARSLANMGNLDLCRARISQAYSRYRQALDAFAACENRRGVAFLSANLGNLMINSFGDLDQGEEFLQQALSYYRQVDDRIGVGHCLSLLGQLAYFRGQMDAARSYLEDGIDCLVNAGEVWIAVQGYTMLVPVSLETGDEKTALECIEKAETLCREHGMDDMLTGVLSCKGYVWLRLGDCARAYHLSSQAMQRIGDDVLDAQIHYYYHYHIARACGRWGEAREALQKAVRLVESILEGLDPEQREIAKANVWDFREILSAWESMQPRRQKVRLPRADAPRGRPLRDDEYVEITWTLWTPEDASITQKTERRRARLLRLVQEAAAQGAAPTQQHLAEALGVGVRTIARDMAALRAEGNAIPVRH